MQYYKYSSCPHTNTNAWSIILHIKNIFDPFNNDKFDISTMTTIYDISIFVEMFLEFT